MLAIGLPCLSCEKVLAKKVNKNAPSEKINPLCYQEARASTMAAWKIPTVLCFDKMGQEVMMDKISR